MSEVKNYMKNEFFNFVIEINKNNIFKPFLKKSYSLELLFFLYENTNFSGIESLYDQLQFPKGKFASFRVYIYYLNDKNCLTIEDNPIILREKTVKLSSEVFLELDALVNFYKE